MNCIICGAEYQQEHEHRPGLCEKCVAALTDFDYTNALKARASAESSKADVRQHIEHIEVTAKGLKVRQDEPKDE